jgi:RNA polymerase sigma-70 factor (ECF subfamily)
MTSLPNVSDEHLIQQFAQGDPIAFDTLYNRHVKAVYRRVRYTVPETDVEDVIQDVFYAALRYLPRFRGEAQFTTWLRTITDRKVAEFYRRRARKRESLQVDLEHAEKQGDQMSASLLEDRATLRDALLALRQDYREIILLRFAEDMPFKEIACLLKKKPEAVKSLFRRAMSAFGTQLEIYDE